MKRRKSKGFSLASLLLCSLLTCYSVLWAKLSSSSTTKTTTTPSTTESDSTPSVATRTILPYTVPDSKEGTTLIVAFCNYGFRTVGVTWYQRMSQLGYRNHLLVATDQAMASFLAKGGILGTQDDVRYHIWEHEPMPKEVQNRPKPKQDHAYLELLMAVRWKYLLNQLERNGMNIVLTDVDNIFTRYIDVDQDFSQTYAEDVIFAYATKYPRKAFAQQGFVVCSGMSWWRSSEPAIRLARLMQNACGDMCDDQRELNNLLSTSAMLDMTWHWDDKILQSRLTNATTSDLRFIGLPTKGIIGFSSVTGHTARVWDRDFAFRGSLYPEPCPINNWVAMPILEAKSRQSAWKTKVESFAHWDEHCKRAGRP